MALISTNSGLAAILPAEIDTNTAASTKCHRQSCSRILRGEIISRKPERSMRGQSVGRYCGRAIGFGDALQQKSSGVLGHVKMQFKVRALPSNLGRLFIDKQIGILEGQPTLWLMVKLTVQLGSNFSGFRFQKQPCFYRILQSQGKPEKLGIVE